MKSSEITAALRKAPLFEALGDDELAALTEGAHAKPARKDEWVVRQNDPGEEMYIVAAGRFRAVVSQEDEGLDRELGEIGPGHHFGEMAMLEKGARGASLQALEDGWLIGLRRENLVKAVDRTPELGLDLCRGFIRLLRASRDVFTAIPFVKLDDPASLGDCVKLLSPRICAACQALVVEHSGDRVVVGMVDPYDKPAREFIAGVLSDYRVNFAGIGRKAFARASEAVIRPGRTLLVGDMIDNDLRYLDNEGEPVDFGDGEAADILREVFGKAVTSGASDIHFEPTTGPNRVRLRLEGSMFPAKEGISDDLFRRLIARVKAMSALDTTNTRLPEDGRFILTAGDEQVEIRVATAPCLGGQKASLRLVDPRRRHRDLDSLFVSHGTERLCRDVLMNPSGLALVVGPTGSGKTTTLYATLNALWEESKTINVVTIEDPIEYELPFATQQQVNQRLGLGFETMLRSTLRQSPDVILVGEIRDAESAAIATEAAGTGHLVLSSLHTDSAVDAVVRLRRLGVPPYLLASCLRGVISQRLLPTVCTDCSTGIGPDDEAADLARRIGLLPDDFQGRLRRGSGCESCRSTGEAGRTAVFEMLAVDDDMRALIEDDAGANRLRTAPSGSDFLPLDAYARMLLERGMISPERAVSLFPKLGRRSAEG